MKNSYEFKFTIGIGVLLVIIGIILISIFLVYPQYREEVTFASTVVGAICAIYSAFYVGYGLKEQGQMSKLQNSFSFMDKYDDLEYHSLAPYLDPNFDPDTVNPTDFYNTVCNNAELQSAIRLRYNFFEDLSLAIQNDYVNEKVVYDSIDSILQLHCDKFDKWVEGHKQLFHEPNELYIETRKLKNSWSDKKFLLTGKSIEKQ